MAQLVNHRRLLVVVVAVVISSQAGAYLLQTDQTSTTPSTDTAVTEISATGTTSTDTTPTTPPIDATFTRFPIDETSTTCTTEPTVTETSTTSVTTTDTTPTTPTTDVTITAVPTESTTPRENCSMTQKQLACDLLKNKNISLATVHASGRTDNAFAENNLKDMCEGKKAARSSYSCPECPSGAPGGSVCISDSVLEYLAAVGAKGRVKVNEIAGACHSCNSKHYKGLAIDLDDGPRDKELIEICQSKGGKGIDEGTHIHCQFDN